ncbi:hypothetical protein ILUMI_19849 [Ignelater luminosus]|uniref:Retrotransposon gag domain-containing protein n=1 Tax=Ignelater luminosus TaxID=2038154 RepID=A0A8K0CHE9_IGNLU|nr:hypothetical protein ILUMI_19849 [Ignelater luminosus]
MTSTSSADSDSSTSSTPRTSDFTIEFLCKLIPQEFSGDRYELGPFIANCNNANDLASDNQKTALLYYILSKITGRAKEQLAQQSFRNWNDLKEKLKTLYQDKKHYCQIMEDLNNCKQNLNESVSDFFQRLELLNSRALSATQQYTIDKTLLPGKLQSINEITLNRFIYHSTPQISQMLRWKDFTLNEAYAAAVAEERALNIYKSVEAAGVKERENALETNNAHEDGTSWKTVYLDGSWSKRSHGHNYDALSEMSSPAMEADMAVEEFSADEFVASYNMGKRLSLVQWHYSPWKRVTGQSSGKYFKKFMTSSIQTDEKAKARRRLLFDKETDALVERSRDEKLWREEMLPALKHFSMQCIDPGIVTGNITKNKRYIDSPYIKNAIKQREECRRIKPQRRKDSISIKTT